jgi:putative transcriptional regulator
MVPTAEGIHEFSGDAPIIGIRDCRQFIVGLDIYVALTQYICVTENNTPRTSPGESGLFNRIAVLRAERGVTRQQLADALNVNYQTIGFLERGDYSPSLKLAFGLSEFFGLPVEAIFSKTPFQPLSEQVYGTRSGDPAVEQKRLIQKGDSSAS